MCIYLSIDVLQSAECIVKLVFPVGLSWRPRRAGGSVSMSFHMPENQGN